MDIKLEPVDEEYHNEAQSSNDNWYHEPIERKDVLESNVKIKTEPSDAVNGVSIKEEFCQSVEKIGEQESNSKHGIIKIEISNVTVNTKNTEQENTTEYSEITIDEQDIKQAITDAEERFICHVCCVVFKTQDNLNDHVNLHNGGSHTSISVTESQPGKTRKRKRNPDGWKRNELCRERYSSKNIPQYPTCKHNSQKIECRTLNENDIRNFHAAFYKNTEKLAQDAFLVNFCKASSVASHNDAKRKKSLNIKYFSRNCQTGAMIPVCQKTFLGILNINKGRVQGVVKRFRSNAGKLPAERRGGNKINVNFDRKNASVIKFLKSLKGSEPYYCRSETQRKIYLSADLNICKLWRMYNSSQNELKVKEKYFRDIFNTKFNISFKTPATDKCSTCSEYTERLNTLESKDRKDLMILSRIHRLGYKAFYSIMQEDEANLLTMSFDFQNSLSLPKLPEQIAYFSRQWSFYHFCIVVGNSKTILSPLNVNSYIWNDTERLKSSNEISSALFHRLIHTDFGVSVTKLRLVADSGGGQNKNTSLLCMLSKWLQEHSPPQMKIVEVLFPVAGHSFIPPNRVFGRIDKVIKCRKVISDPDEYISILKQHGIVFDLGKDVPVFDWRKAANEYFMPLGNWHFRFDQTNRFFLTKTSTNEIKLQGEETYRAQHSTPQFVTKKRSCTLLISPESLPSRKVVINKNKLKDVNILLKKYYGENWRQLDALKFYRDIEELSEQFQNI